MCGAIALWALMRRRPGGRGWHAGASAAEESVFEQWPTGALVVNPVTLQILAAKPAALRSLGYTPEEVRGLRFTEIFCIEGLDRQALMGRLRDASIRTSLEMIQCCQE